jgi:hypothetical protein
VEPSESLATNELIIDQRIDNVSDLVNLHQEVRVALCGTKGHVIADAALVVVMLGGDACRYGKPPVTMRMLRSPDRGHLRIEVDDHRPDTAEPTPEDYRSRLLERMTDARGVDRQAGVTTTWVEIRLVAEALAS